MSPDVSGSAPEISANVVLLPAPLGRSVRGSRRSRISNDRSLTATSPPNGLRAGFTSSSGPSCAARWSRRPAARASGTGGGDGVGSRRSIHGHTPSRARCSSTISSTPNTIISKLPERPRSCGQHVLQHLLQERDQRRADHGAPDAAGAADHRHEQVLDARGDAERRRIHEALQVRVEPAGDAGQQRRVHEHDDLEPRTVDAERLAPCRSRRAARGSRGPGRESSRLCVAHSAASASAQIR